MKGIITTGLVFSLATLSGLVRYLLLQIFPQEGAIPWTLLAINFTGIFLLVFFVKIYLPHRSFSPTLLTGLGVGFLGGLTTLATPLLDLVLTLQKEDWGLFALLLILHLGGGLAIAYVAYDLAHRAKGGAK